MVSTQRIVGAALLCVGVSMIASCNGSGSLVVVSIQATPALRGIARIQATAKVGEAIRNFEIPVNAPGNTPSISGWICLPISPA